MTDLEPGIQRVAVSVGPDEEPEHHIAAPAPDSAVINADSDRPQILMRRELLEPQAGMMGVLPEQAVRVTNLPPYGGRQARQVATEI
jgi:hypothetical protein